MAIMPKGQREQVLLLLSVLAAGAIGAYHQLVYIPKGHELAQQQARADDLVVMNQRAKAELATGSVSELRRQLADYQQSLNLIRTLVPQSNEVPALLEQVSTAARRAGLDIASVDPQPVAAGDQYDTHRYTVAVLGSYHQLGEFLANVGGLTRIVLSTNLTLQAKNAPPPANASQVKRSGAAIEARLQLQTYVARTASPEPIDPRPGKSGA